MNRETFLERLIFAGDSCCEFTRQFVLDSLPSTYRFWVLLNCSYDKNLTDDEVVFPDDVQEHGSRVGPLTGDAVVSLLWREGMVPKWIDISVWESDQNATHFQLKCCGRFSANAERLYYRETDCAPFGIKGPFYPARLATSAARGDPVEKFSLAESREDDIAGRDDSE